MVSTRVDLEEQALRDPTEVLELVEVLGGLEWIGVSGFGVSGFRCFGVSLQIRALVRGGHCGRISESSMWKLEYVSVRRHCNVIDRNIAVFDYHKALPAFVTP